VLESVLQYAEFACVVVSHDRYFLENVANAMVELSRSYEDGYLRVAGNYSKFSGSQGKLFACTAEASGRVGEPGAH